MFEPSAETLDKLASLFTTPVDGAPDIPIFVGGIWLSAPLPARRPAV